LESFNRWDKANDRGNAPAFDKDRRTQKHTKEKKVEDVKKLTEKLVKEGILKKEAFEGEIDRLVKFDDEEEIAYLEKFPEISCDGKLINGFADDVAKKLQEIAKKADVDIELSIETETPFIPENSIECFGKEEKLLSAIGFRVITEEDKERYYLRARKILCRRRTAIAYLYATKSQSKRFY
jgi:hypothetical protein